MKSKHKPFKAKIDMKAMNIIMFLIMRMILKHMKRRASNKKFGKKGEWQIYDNV